MAGECRRAGISKWWRRLAQQSAVVPARFGTVFSGDEALIADVKRRKRGIATTLKRVADSDEWGVKVFGEPPKPLMEVKEGASSGRDYLKRKAVVLERRGERKPDAELTRLVSAPEEDGDRCGSGRQGQRWTAKPAVAGCIPGKEEVASVSSTRC